MHTLCVILLQELGETDERLLQLQVLLLQAFLTPLEHLLLQNILVCKHATKACNRMEAC